MPARGEPTGTRRTPRRRWRAWPTGRGAAAARRGALGAVLLAVVLVWLAPAAMSAPDDPPPSPPSTSQPRSDEEELTERQQREDERREDAAAEQQQREHDEAERERADAREAEQQARQEERQNKRAKQRAFEKKVAAYRKALGEQDGAMSAFHVADQHGVPVTAYGPIIDTGWLLDGEGKFQGLLIRGIFTFVMWIIAFSCWLIAWALSWSLAGILLKPAQHISDALYGNAIVQLGLPGLLMAFSSVVACWQLFFGRRQRGWGELLASTVLAALAAATVFTPPSMLLSEKDGAVGGARDLGLAVSAIVMGNEDTLQDATDARALTRPMTDKLAETFIVQPSMLLSYGQVFHGKCAQAYSESRLQQAVFELYQDKMIDRVHDKMAVGEVNVDPGLATGPGKWLAKKGAKLASDVLGVEEPSKAFEKKCVDGSAGEAKKASWQKVGAVLFIAVAAVLVFALLLVTGCSYLAAQAVLAVEAMFAKAVVVLGIMPGPGRAMLWKRAVNVLRALGMLVALAVLLAVIIVMIQAILGASASSIPGGLTGRFFTVDLLIFAAFKWRKQLTGYGQSLAADLRGRLGSSSLGGSNTAELGAPPPQRGGFGRKIGSAALLGLALASGGGSSLASAGGRYGRRALGARLAAGGARGGAKLTAKTAAATGKGAWKAGKFAGRYTLGAPVHLPRTARNARGALTAAPSRAADHTRAVRSRLHDAWRAPHRAQWRAEYAHHTGARALANRWRAARGLPPTPSPAARTFTTRTDPPATADEHGSSTRPGSTSTPPGRSRRHNAPPVTGPPSSAQQTRLRRQAYRSRTRTNGSGSGTGGAESGAPPRSNAPPPRGRGQRDARVTPPPGGGTTRRRGGS